MTSKEALERIKNTIIVRRNYNRVVSIFNKEEIETIEKDLEVLEIIKKWSFIQENYKDGYGPFTQFICNIHTIGMEKDFNKVKEWLENE